MGGIRLRFFVIIVGCVLFKVIENWWILIR